MDGGNCAVLQAVGASLQSLIGPNKGVKMCVPEGEGRGLMMTDTMQVLTMVTQRIQHPAGHVIHSAARCHHGNHGCGVASLVCLAAAWSREILDLQNQDVPLPVIFSVFEECLDASETIVASLSMSLALLRDQYSRRHSSSTMGTRETEKRAMSYSRNFRAGSSGEENGISGGFLEELGKRLCRGREMAMQLAVKAVEPQVNTESTLDISKVMSLPLVGVASQHSRVVEGVVCRLRHDMVHIVHQNKDTTLRTVVLCGDAIMGYSHKGLKGDVKLSTALKSCDLRLESHDPWLQTCCDMLTKYSVGLLVVQGTVSPALYEVCLSRSILLLTRLPASHTSAICRVSGARVVNYVTQIRDESDVGMVRVVIVEGGWSRVRVRDASQRRSVGGEATDYYCCVKPATSEGHCDVNTAILCGHTHSQTSILQYSLHNCLNRLRCVMSDRCVVRGGGWVEMMVAELLRKKYTTECSESCGWLDGSGQAISSHSVSVPYCMQTSWLGQHLCSSGVESCAILNGFAAGLEHFAALTWKSSELGMSFLQALSEVKNAQRECKATGAREQDGQQLVGSAASLQGGGGRGDVSVLDASSCKIAVWKSAYRLVRTLVSVTYIAQQN